MSSRRIILCAWVVLSFSTAAWAQNTYEYRRVRVEHNIGKQDEAYIKAIAKIVDFAASRAIEYGFDMPTQFRVTVHLDPNQNVRLSTTGDFQIHFSIQNTNQLLAPAKSGVNIVYGLCHEIGHICQYRILKPRAWMSTGACEGWAHYFGAHVVDLLFKKHGKKIWPDEHDYSNKGLKKALMRMKSARDETNQGADRWNRLASIVGIKGVPGFFRRLNDAGIDAFNAAADVERVLSKEKKGSKLVKWWKEARQVLVKELEKSAFKTETVKKRALSGKPKLLSHDEGDPTGKVSWPGSSGAAVAFEVSRNSMYLTEVHVYGMRYGKKTDEHFFLWLLDDEFKAITCFSIPYEEFAYGPAHWETLEVPPTLVPRDFFICVIYNSESDKGVFRYHDGSAGANSFSGVPGEAVRGYNNGDWLIRAVVRRKK